MSDKTQWVEGAVLESRKLSILFDFGADDTIWVPRSLIEDYDPEHFNDGETIKVELPEWFCEQEDIWEAD